MEISLTLLPERLQLALAQTPQDPAFHGEGDVAKHTEAVCRAMRDTESWQKGNAATRQVLELAALLHDLGKIPCTRWEDGHLVSPGHGRVGSEMARQFLWQELGLCGTPEKIALREAVCALIRDHGLPPHAIDESDGKLRLLRFAADGALSPGITAENLCALSEADIRGRICSDELPLLEQVQLCRELAAESGCLQTPYAFPDDHTAYAFLSGRNISPEYPLYNDTWGSVTLMSGLPGTGKDTWIRENLPDMPMISLDEIRTEQKISPTDNQEPVVQLARERARELLRKKQPFIWNATNLTPMTRQKQIHLFCDYGASVEIVYLETTREEQFSRNANRPDAVPEGAVCHMLEKLTPPRRMEAHTVRWICV